MRKALPGNATVTICNSHTKDLPSITRQADVLIAAIGRANFVTGDMIKEGVAVIDVGINRVEDITKKHGYRLVGDVEFEAVAPKSSHTPVPGGVGPMTVAMLMHNATRLQSRQSQMSSLEPNLPRQVSTRTKTRSLQGPAPVTSRLGLSQGWSHAPREHRPARLSLLTRLHPYLSRWINHHLEDRPPTVASRRIH